jgi:hypothetical protein
MTYKSEVCGGNDLINYHKTTEDEKYEICGEAFELSRESYPGSGKDIAEGAIGSRRILLQ